jgi:hypothetical protein
VQSAGDNPASLIRADKVVVIKKKRVLLLVKNGEILRKYRLI